MNILILKKEKENDNDKDKDKDKDKIINKSFKKLNDKIIWYGNEKLTNYNRMFFTKHINYVIILYDSINNNFNLQDIKNLINIYINLKLNAELIIYAVININNKNNKTRIILEYLFDNYPNIKFINNDINDLENYIINNL